MLLDVDASLHRIRLTRTLDIHGVQDDGSLNERGSIKPVSSYYPTGSVTVLAGCWVFFVLSYKT